MVTEDEKLIVYHKTVCKRSRDLHNNPSKQLPKRDISAKKRYAFCLVGFQSHYMLYATPTLSDH